MTRSDPCPLCQPLTVWEIRRTEHWRTIVNRNQNLLGKLFIALRRHEESVAALDSSERSALHGEIQWAVRRLEAVFQPDHSNHAFLQNQDRHVHVHVIPRYATERRFAGRRFLDPGYPAHYSLDTEEVVDETFAERLGRALASG